MVFFSKQQIYNSEGLIKEWFSSLSNICISVLLLRRERANGWTNGCPKNTRMLLGVTGTGTTTHTYNTNTSTFLKPFSS